MQFPPEIARALEGWVRVDDETIGRSDASVFVFERDDAKRFLKVGGDADAEASILEWLRGRVPVASVVAIGDEHLLTDGLPGVRACDPPWGDDLDGLVAHLGRALRRWHDTPSTGCPVDRSPWRLLELARRRVEAGLVGENRFAPEYAGRSPEQILRRLETSIPERYVPTLIHGDFSLPNVLVDGVDVWFVDVGSAGVGDRHLDLAIAARSLAYNWGEEWVPLLFERYGQFPDPDRINWYRLLDELF